jgi:hypothetical protein
MELRDLPVTPEQKIDLRLEGIFPVIPIELGEKGMVFNVFEQDFAAELFRQQSGKAGFTDAKWAFNNDVSMVLHGLSIRSRDVSIVQSICQREFICQAQIRIRIQRLGPSCGVDGALYQHVLYPFPFQGGEKAPE